MENFKAEIQLPTGKNIDVTPKNGMPIVRGLLEETNYAPELVTSLWIKARLPDGKIIQIILPTVDEFQPVIEILDK